jgi:hypothetical protein
MPAETLLEFKGENRNGSFKLPQFPVEDSMLKAVLADTSLSKEYTYSKWVVQPSFHSEYDGVASYRSDIFDSVIVQPNVDIYASVNGNMQFDSEVYFRTYNTWKRFVFGVQYWGSALLILLIAYFTYKLIKQIIGHNEFLKQLYKNTFTIGILFMCKIVLNLLLSFIYTYWYGRIELRSVPSLDSNKGFLVSINPTLDFDFTSFLFALVLIVLASLFKYGYELEQEKQMTI